MNKIYLKMILYKKLLILYIYMITLCKSVKSKTLLSVQCCNKPKPGELFCGTHLKSKNIIIFTEICQIIMETSNIENNTENNNNIFNCNNSNSSNCNGIDTINTCIEMNKLELTNTDKKTDIIIYTKDELFQKIASDKYINIGSIRKSIKKIKELKYINISLSKPLLINEIKKEIEKERYYLCNIDSIIMIQSYIRRWFIKRIKTCSNDSDILTFTSLYDIDLKYFYIFRDDITKKKYGYDFRTLLEIINSDYPSCPYTFRTFSTYEKELIFQHRDFLMKKGVDINIEKAVLSPEEEIDMRIKDVFHKINMLDNYTNPIWFKNLNIYQLHELYIKSEDMWNYRSGMSLDSKKKIVQNGCIFNIPIHIVKNIKIKTTIQNILLAEFTRMISEGIDREEKKLGAILILTSLVEVSSDAADALPHLIQI